MVIMSLDEFYIQHHNFISLLLMFMLSRMCFKLFGTSRIPKRNECTLGYKCLLLFICVCQLSAVRPTQAVTPRCELSR